MKPIIVSPHAFERLESRKINRPEVESTVNSPDWKGAVKHGKLKFIKQFGDRWLHVIVKEKSRYHILVTAYWGS